MDIGSAVSRALGVTERQLLELGRYETSDAFDEDERLAIELAVAMCGDPVVITADLRERLAARFTRTQLVELRRTSRGRTTGHGSTARSTCSQPGSATAPCAWCRSTGHLPTRQREALVALLEAVGAQQRRNR